MAASDRQPLPDTQRQDSSRPGFSDDQPAPGDPRYIAPGTPEPSEHVRMVTILERDPAYLRWRRVASGAWRVEGSLGGGGMLIGPPGRLAPTGTTVAWELVGVCACGTAHSMKDVSGSARLDAV